MRERAHNPKVVGSNPTPATKLLDCWYESTAPRARGLFFLEGGRGIGTGGNSGG